MPNKPAQYDLIDHCPICFHALAENECEFCGKDPRSRSRPPLALPLGFNLVERYIIGGVRAGHEITGFTYNGYDTDEKCNVVIKEFLPRNLAGRNLRTGMVVAHAEKEALFNFGKAEFVAELEKIRKIDHKFLTTVHSFHESNGSIYAILPAYPEQNLRDYVLEQGGRIDVFAALELFEKIASVVSTLHEHRRLHCDLRPENIYIDAQRNVILADQGYAKYALAERTLSLFHTVTPGFAPPEQYYSQSTVTVASDVYSLAAILYFLLSGVAPPEAIERTQCDILPLPSGAIPGLPARFDRPLLEGLAIAPQSRPQSVDAFYRQLKQVSDSVHFVGYGSSIPTHQSLVAIPQPTRQDAIIKWTLRTVAGLVVVFLAGLGGYFLNSGPPSVGTTTGTGAENLTPTPTSDATTPTLATTDKSTPEPLSGNQLAGIVERNLPASELVDANAAVEPVKVEPELSVSDQLLADAMRQMELGRFAYDAGGAWSFIKSAELLGASAADVSKAKQTLLQKLSSAFLVAVGTNDVEKATELLVQARKVPMLDAHFPLWEQHLNRIAAPEIDVTSPVANTSTLKVEKSAADVEDAPREQIENLPATPATAKSPQPAAAVQAVVEPEPEIADQTDKVRAQLIASSVNPTAERAPELLPKAVKPVMPAKSVYHHNKMLQRKADGLAGLSQRVNSPVAHIWYENGNGREYAFAIGDNGELALRDSIQDGVFSFVWPFDARRVTVFFAGQTRNGEYQFDKPIELDFNRYFAARMVTTGEVAWSELYINNRHELGFSENYVLEDHALPGQLQLDANGYRLLQDVPALYVRGDMNGWAAENLLLATSAYSFESPITLTDQHYIFKFADESWTAKWNFGAGFNAAKGLNRSAGADNLQVNLPANGVMEYKFVLHLLPIKGNLYPVYELQENASPDTKNNDCSGGFRFGGTADGC